MTSSAAITPEQRRREAALLLAAILDGFIGALLLAVGLAGDLLTCLAESMRGNMMWTIDLVSLAVLRRLHRGRLSGFDFGTRKIEQLCSIAIACGLIAAALWLGYDALGLIAAGRSLATPRSASPPWPAPSTSSSTSSPGKRSGSPRAAARRPSWRPSARPAGPGCCPPSWCR